MGAVHYISVWLGMYSIQDVLYIGRWTDAFSIDYQHTQAPGKQHHSTLGYCALRVPRFALASCGLLISFTNGHKSPKASNDCGRLTFSYTFDTVLRACSIQLAVECVVWISHEYHYPFWTMAAAPLWVGGSLINNVVKREGWILCLFSWKLNEMVFVLCYFWTRSRRLF